MLVFSAGGACQDVVLQLLLLLPLLQRTAKAIDFAGALDLLGKLLPHKVHEHVALMLCQPCVKFKRYIEPGFGCMVEFQLHNYCTGVSHILRFDSLLRRAGGSPRILCHVLQLL